jgi:hypothetical protein
LGVLTLPAAGAPIQLIEGLPSEYKPGDPIAFEVRMPAITNLGSYNIDLVLESSTGTAGVDFYFDVAATQPASAHYVFLSTANFFDAANVDSASRHRLTLTDFDLEGMNAVPGTNDRVATVVLQTLSSFFGHLALSVDTEGLILDTPDSPTPVSGFDTLQADIAASGVSVIVPVPEPSVAFMTAAAIIGALFWRGSPERIRSA